MPDMGTAQKKGKGAEGSWKSKNNWNRNDCCTSQYLVLFCIQHALYTYTLGNVYVNMFLGTQYGGVLGHYNSE